MEDKLFKTGIFGIILVFSLYLAGLNLIACNFSFWSLVISAGCAFVICLFFIFRWLVKPLIGLILIGNAVTFYFMNTYNVMIDSVMMLNVLETDIGEIKELLSLKFWMYVVVWGIIPCLILWKTEIFRANYGKRYAQGLAVVGGFLIILLLAAYFRGDLDIKRLKENKTVLYKAMPINYALADTAVIKSLYSGKRVEKIDSVGILNRYWQNDGKKNLFVVIVGETARAANFSLNGYGRGTNDFLQPFADNLFYFKNAEACGTATSISVPCLFSARGREDFNKREEQYRENVLDIFNHNGYNVLWRENNSSCKNVCKRVETQVFCDGLSCLDDKIQEDFPQKFNNIHDAVIVLHQGGSHGPDYSKRYPEEFEFYKPACHNNIPKDCPPGELVNSYDNSIVYSSYLLAELFEKLKAVEDKYNIAVFYTSDHGESLGEDGIYLHSAPYDEAPSYQKEVPFLVYIPDTTLQSMNYKTECLKAQTERRISHDYLFHSLLGLAGIKTREYNKNLDIFSNCHEVK